MSNPTFETGGFADIPEAREIAKGLFETYDTNKSGVIEPTELSKMIEEAYHTINKEYKPTASDIDDYTRLLDRNHDGKITLIDLEALCVKYLVGLPEDKTNP